MLCVLLGFGAWVLDLANLSHLSFDLMFLFQPKPPPGDAVIVSMDASSQRKVHADPFRTGWSRLVHARLLDKVFHLGAEAVVFDIVFAGPRPDPAEDSAFAAALARHEGRVVLGADLEVRQSSEQPGTFLEELVEPWPGLGTNPRMGVVNFQADSSKAVRRLWHRPNTNYLSLAQHAVSMVRPSLAPPDRELWMRCYGPRGSLSAVPYDWVLAQPDLETNLYTGKVLFVGNNPPKPNGQDEFNTPFTLWTRIPDTGVALHATAFLNLLHGDALVRMAPGWEFLLLVVSGVLVGFGLAWLRPAWSVWVGLLLVPLALAGASWLTWSHSVWFAWAVIPLVQVPAATLWSFAAHTRMLSHEKMELQSRIQQSEIQALAFSQSELRHLPVIPDHELLKCVGRGAYGEVWLARDVLGSFHAVKIIHRNTFTEAAPYEREFRGIKKFTPISRQHPGWVDILHVGRNDKAGYFFYIMEAGDDVERGQEIAPDTYEPRTLGGDLTQGPLPVPRCLELGAALAHALEHLHAQGLIHRDIKPSNVIFVRGQPKFADIGLVTEIASQSDVSRIGTEGYMAPEGPGSPGSDVYSLGKLLYETALGRDPRAFPEMPTRLFDLPDEDPSHRLYQVIARACEANPTRRYQSATEFRAALKELESTL